MRVKRGGAAAWRVEEDTLIVEGEFYALSSGINGGFGRVGHLFNHTVSGGEVESPQECVERVAERFGMRRYFGLLTAVPMHRLCAVERDELQVFVTAGIDNPNPRVGTINIIAVIDAELPEGAMVNAVITATEAKCHTLIEMGFRFTGTCTDAVIIAKTGRGERHTYAGPRSRLGRKLWEAVKAGIARSLEK